MTIENRGPELTAVCATFVTTTVIAVALRCYVRLRIVRNFGIDDWVMVGALVSVSFYYLEILLTFYSIGLVSYSNCIHPSRSPLRHRAPLLGS